MNYELTKHALDVLNEREIQIAWMERCIFEPEFIQPDPNDSAIERRYRKIPEFDGRVLRVAVNTTVEPIRIVSVFFDRTMKGKL